MKLLTPATRLQPDTVQGAGPQLEKPLPMT